MSAKVVLITGASSGMGLISAMKYIKGGYTVYAAARRMDNMEVLAKFGAKTIYLDVTDEESAKKCVDTIIRNEGCIDILINNAGYGTYCPVETTPMEEIRRQFEVNYFGLVRMTQLVLPHMREQHSGRIINIASMGANFTIPFGAWYHGTKYAVKSFTDALRQETSEFGIKTICIEPGMIQTDWGIIAANNIRKNAYDNVYRENMLHAADYFDHLYKNTKKLTNPDVVANAIYKAGTVAKPKTCYHVGKNARFFPFAKRLLSDRIFDKICLDSMGIKISG